MLFNVYTAFTILVLTTCLALAGCESQSTRLRQENQKHVDFSGDWELDYGQSDNIQTKLNILVRELRRQAEKRSRSGVDNRTGAGSVVVGSNGRNSGPSIVGLAQMAELITQSQLLGINQSRTDITVKREETFALTCEFYEGESTRVENPLGAEICGWDSRQLLFRILLPEGLSIQHRLSLGPSGNRLNIATTVVSDRVSYPFTLNRVYNRYRPGSRGYTCKMTLTRGKVCTTKSS
ncbi:MAG: hypothetical protein HOC23_23340 [Halieaceae bacterium]|jgi:hypothetical protein|nr:hypothetical protein [Halieaceae bacterium]